VSQSFHMAPFHADIGISLPGPRNPITHPISTLSPSKLYSRVTLGGWLVNRRQANSSLCFFNLKDSSGSVQLVLNTKKFGQSGSEEEGKKVVEEMMRVPLHSVVQVEGTIQHKKAVVGASQSVSIPDLRLH
jgi:aspartyl-tRNA synthetase